LQKCNKIHSKNKNSRRVKIMNTKGQGALEYLLLIGGAVLVAAIVIALVTGIPTTTPDPRISAGCASQFTCQACVAYDVTGVGGALDCRAQMSDNSYLTTVATCNSATVAFKACVPR
jgi:hypothetical protein